MHALITSLKEAGQDFEFYPTSQEIIAAMVRDMKRNEYTGSTRDRDYSRRSYDSLLDIGAGNGKVLRAIQKAFVDKEGRRQGFTELYAIEKSPILCEQLDASVFVVGTEFEQQSLLSKQVDVIFSNPPYSIFEQWTVKIIRESAAPVVYLVIPERWKDSVPIADALKYRGGKSKVVGDFTFEHVEDRQARAKVHLLRINLQGDKDDAFERFFNEQFGGLRAKFEASKAKPKKEDDDGADPRFASLVVGENYPAAMVALYNQEMAHIQRNYEAVALLDVELMREFDISPESIMKCLKERLTGLRNLYWKELFSRMGAITDRLTGKKRGLLLETLNRHCHVDFTVDNIHAVIIWVLKNANDYLDIQLIETFEQMIDKANVKNYESNKRAFVWDRWRYNGDNKATHFALEYRLVLQHLGGIKSGYSSWDSGLAESACDFLADLLTVARNLGFLCSTGDYRLGHHRNHWMSNKLETFYFTNALTQKREILFEVRAFKNRNCHIRMHQRLALALNVEYGRLKGWLKSGQEASEELKDPEAAACFKTHLCLPTGGNPLLLLGGLAA